MKSLRLRYDKNPSCAPYAPDDWSISWLWQSPMELLSWSLHNLIAWWKIRPFLSCRASKIYLFGLLAAQPYWIVKIYANFVFSNHGGCGYSNKSYEYATDNYSILSPTVTLYTALNMQGHPIPSSAISMLTINSN
jgi:hypothetical protein